MSHPWMPFYVADYLGDTGHLTTLEHGAYILLICHYWRTGGLPTDDAHLARIVRLSLKAWHRIKPDIEPLFLDGWRHKRIEAEFAKQTAIGEKRALAGRKGGATSSAARVNAKTLATTAAYANSRTYDRESVQTVDEKRQNHGSSAVREEVKHGAIMATGKMYNDFKANSKQLLSKRQANGWQSQPYRRVLLKRGADQLGLPLSAEPKLATEKGVAVKRPHEITKAQFDETLKAKRLVDGRLHDAVDECRRLASKG